MIKSMTQSENDAVLRVADLMVAAAKTAPKGDGRDTVIGAVVTGEEKAQLAAAMRRLGTAYEQEFIVRDGDIVDASVCVVLLGCIDTPFGLEHCGLCGLEDCAKNKKAGGRCALNISDLGIAVGSAVAIAADNRIDNRVMYSAGIAALDIRLFPENICVCYGIPLHTSAKSIFFDREPGMVL